MKKHIGIAMLLIIIGTVLLSGCATQAAERKTIEEEILAENISAFPIVNIPRENWEDYNPNTIFAIPEKLNTMYLTDKISGNNMTYNEGMIVFEREDADKEITFTFHKNIIKTTKNGEYEIINKDSDSLVVISRISPVFPVTMESTCNNTAKGKYVFISLSQE